MIARLIHFSIRNKLVVVLMTVALIVTGIIATARISIDAIPDLSDVQVILITDYPGQAPNVVEDQITYPLTTAPVRPNETAPPTPVARIRAGYTCAASANIVVCTPLIRAPVTVSIPMMGAAGDPAEIGMKAMTLALATASPAIVSITGREPQRVIETPPVSAPATPPRLNAIMPALATADERPAAASIDGTQLKAR